MTAALLTPRVRLLAICDGVRESKTEAGVYHLKGVRQSITANAFPFVPVRLWLFLVLFSPRAGKYPVYCRVVNNRTEKTIFHGKVEPDPTFQSGEEPVARSARIKCKFPETGRYTLQVWFFQSQGDDVLKGEVPFSVTAQGT